MEFRVVYYEDEHGHRPVEEFILDLKRVNPDLHRLTVKGLGKLRDSRNHGEPMTKSVGEGLFELRIGHKDTARILWFFVAGAKIVLAHGFVKKTDRIPEAHRRKALSRRDDYLVTSRRLGR
jgi:phage-related protein